METKKQQVQEMTLKPRRELAPKPQIQWQQVPKRNRREEVMKNLSVAAALVICAAALRSGVIPPLDQTTDAILAAATGDTLLDENLGKLSFVSKMFPEATLVFGEQAGTAFEMPVTEGEIVHAWSESEPYISWQTAQRQVQAAADGEVTAIFHGNGEERVVQIVNDAGLTCLYGNIEQCHVTVGDAVQQGDTVGTLLQDASCVLEVRQDGRSIDPSLWLP